MNQNNDVLIPFLNIVSWIFHNYVQARRKQFGIRGGWVGVGGGGGQTSQKRKLVATGPVDEPFNANW